MRWIPVIFFALFVGIGFGWRSWWHRHRFGHSGLVLFRSGRWSQHLRDASFFAASGLLAVEVIAAAVAPASTWHLAPLASLGPAGVVAGGIVGFAGLVLMVRAQIEMGASWRIGVDEGARPGLITHGPYGWSRNPIYLAMFLAFAGLALMLPTWITLLVFIGSLVVVPRQVREEEGYLLRTYGDEYRRYASRVGRFLPGLGLLRGPGGGRATLAG